MLYYIPVLRDLLEVPEAVVLDHSLHSELSPVINTSKNNSKACLFILSIGRTARIRFCSLHLARVNEQVLDGH